MKKLYGYVDVYTNLVYDIATKENITHLFRQSIIDVARDNDQLLMYDMDSGRARRCSRSEVEPTESYTVAETPIEDTPLDPVMQLIKNAAKINGVLPFLSYRFRSAPCLQRI